MNALLHASKRAGGISRDFLMVVSVSCAFLLPAVADEPVPPPLLEFASGLPGNQVRLTWPAVAGMRYRIEKSTTLGPWEQVALVEATGAEGVWLDPERTAGKAFYRIGQPVAEVFSISPPLLSPTGGEILIYGQLIPPGSFLVLEIEGQPPVFILLEDLGNGVWRAMVVGAFVPGATVISASIQDAAGTTLVVLDQPITVTATGLALDGIPSLPPGAPAALLKTRTKSNQTNERVGGGDASAIAIWGSKKGYQYYMAQSDMNAAGAVNNPYFVGNEMAGEMPTDAIRGKVKDIRVDPMGRSKTTEAKVVLSGSPEGGSSARGWKTFRGGGLLLHETAGVTRLSKTSGLPGEVSFETCDLALETPAGPPLQVVHSYRSIGVEEGGGGTAGSHWEMCYDISIETVPAGSGAAAARVKVRDGAGRCDTFFRQADGSFRCDGMFREGRFDGGVFTLTFADQGKWIFRPLDERVVAQGMISAITDRNGVSLNCDYDFMGLLSGVNSQFGQSITFTRGLDDRISRVTDHTGRFVEYSYYGAGDPLGNEGDLSAISCPQLDGVPPVAGPTTFTYTTGNPDPNLNGNVLSIADGAGRVLESYEYSTETDALKIDYDKPVKHTKTGHVSINRREIRPPGSSPEGGYTEFENDGVGRLTEVVYDRQHRPVSHRSYTGFCTPGVPVTSTSNRPVGKLRPTDPDYFETTCAYNADSLCTRVTNPDGSQELATYDRDFRKQCPVVERGNARVTTLRTPTGEERTVRCDYLPGFGAVECSADGGIIGIAIGSVVGSAASTWKEGNISGMDDWQSQSSRSGITGGAVAGIVVAAVVARMDGGIMAMDDWESPVVRMVSAHGQVTTCSYDTAGNLTSVTSPVPGRGSLYQYNAFGQCTSSTVLNGADSSFQDTCTYDPATHFLSSVTCDSTGLALITTCDRDDLGRITRVVDPRLNDWLCDYNPLDQVTRTESPAAPNRVATDFIYDAGSCLARCDTEHRGADGSLDAANPAYSTFHVYDAHARLIQVAEEERPVDCSGLLVPDTLGLENFSACDITYNNAGECSRVSTPAVCRAQAGDLVCDFTYDERGMIHRTIQGGIGNADACTTECDYSPFGQLIRCAVLETGNNSESLCSHDGFHRISSETDPMGNVSSYEYDNVGYVTRSVFGEVNDVPGSAGNVLLAKVYEAALSKEYSVKSGKGSVHRIVPSTNSHAINTKGAGGDRTYQPGKPVYGNLTFEISRLMKAKEKANRTKCGNNLRTRRPSYNLFSCFPMAFHGVETEDETISCDRFTPGGAVTGEVTTIDRSPAGLVSSVTRNGDLLETRSYDSAGRQIATADGPRYFNFTLDGNNNVTTCTRTDVSALVGIPTKTFTVSHVFDALDRCVQTTDGTGNVSSSAFDSLDRCVSSTEPNGLVTRRTYDSSTSGIPFSEEISADAVTPGAFVMLSRSLVRSGELRSSSDSYGHITTYSSNALGCPIRCDLPDGTFETYTYDRKINLGTIGHVDHGKTEMTHNLKGRILTSLTTGDPNNPPVSSTPVRTFSHDGLGRCVSVVQGSHSVGFGFDSLGNCVSETQDGRTVSSSFSHRGRTGITYQDGRSFVEERDGLGLLLSISALDSGVSVVPPVVVNEYAGHRVVRSTKADGTVTVSQYRGDGEEPISGGADFSFDACVRVAVSDSGTDILHDAIYRRNRNQRDIRTETFFSDGATPPSRSKTIARNRQGHVMVCTTRRRPTAGAQPVIESEVTYTRDLEGRRLSASGGENPGLYTQETTLPPGDQQMGQYTTWPRGPLEWDDNGNLNFMSTATGPLAFSHDVEGRLTSVSRSGVPVISYDYDPLGRCISRDPEVGPTTTFVYDGSRCIQELGSDGLADLSFVCAGSIRQCISTRSGTLFYPQGGGSSSDKPVTHVHGDPHVDQKDGYRDSCSNGDAFAAGILITSSIGAPVERMDFDDAGKPVFLTSEGIPTGTTQSSTGFRWMTPECSWEPEIRMFHGGGGIYSPDLGRVISSIQDEAKGFSSLIR